MKEDVRRRRDEDASKEITHTEQHPERSPAPATASSLYPDGAE